MIRENNFDHIFHAQEYFRLILSAMATPGKTPTLNADVKSVSHINNAAAIVGLTLLNQDVTFYAQPIHTAIREYFTLNTSSLPASAEAADFIFINGDITAVDTIKKAKIGIPEYPETGAFLIIDAASISAIPIAKSIEMTLKGPGVKGEKRIYLSGLHPAILDQILTKNEDYPLGIDTIFTDCTGKILCIPRTNQFQFKKLV